MSRWRQGWELTKKRWAVLKSHRELMRFPIYGALIAMALVIVLVGPGVYLIDDDQRVIGGLLVALGLYGSSFVSIYFGVALAAYYAIRLFQRTMHNRRTENADSREIGVRDALVLAPLVACIIALALYPGLILSRSDTSVKATIAQTCVRGVFSTSVGSSSSTTVVSRCPGNPFDKTPPPVASSISGNQHGWTGYAPINEVSN